jgi:hypothetical protein
MPQFIRRLVNMWSEVGFVKNMDCCVYLFYLVSLANVLLIHH